MKIRIPEYLRLGSTAVLLLVILGVAGVWTLKGIQSEVNSRLVRFPSDRAEHGRRGFTKLGQTDRNRCRHHRGD